MRIICIYVGFFVFSVVIIQTKFFEMFLSAFVPRVSKRYLLLVAALVWTFAGGMLLLRGFSTDHASEPNWTLKIVFCLVGGLLFYKVMFDRISSKHVKRIKSMETERPVVFSFFNLKSYIMMFSMITMGVTFRLTGLVSPVHLALVYVTMGIPLLMSSIRFYYTFFNF